MITLLKGNRMKRLLIMLVLVGILVSVGCNYSKEWQVYPEEEIRNRAAIKLDRETWFEGRMYKR